jgi:hypothetical protein
MPSISASIWPVLLTIAFSQRIKTIADTMLPPVINRFRVRGFYPNP